jgi:hypothetical protein
MCVVNVVFRGDTEMTPDAWMQLKFSKWLLTSLVLRLASGTKDGCPAID